MVEVLLLVDDLVLVGAEIESWGDDLETCSAKVACVVVSVDLERMFANDSCSLSDPLNLIGLVPYVVVALNVSPYAST